MSRDRGSGTVLVLGVCSVLASVAMLLVALGAVAVARHRAASAADLAALAAADRALQGERAACSAAARAAQAAGAQLAGCRLTGHVAVVLAQVRPRGPLGRLGLATAGARAAPGNLGGCLHVCVDGVRTGRRGSPRGHLGHIGRRRNFGSGPSLRSVSATSRTGRVISRAEGHHRHAAVLRPPAGAGAAAVVRCPAG